jgi:hypothetical protein
VLVACLFLASSAKCGSISIAFAALTDLPDMPTIAAA